MKPQISLTVLSILLATLCLFAGCDKEDHPPPNPGPAEQLGRELDKTIRGGVKQAEEAQKKLGERFEQMGKEMQQKAAEEENR
jgi:hypothetical protein